jgi:hypothetical protein
MFIKNFIQDIFINFPRNMMFIHLVTALFFLILWQLQERNILKVKSSELIFGIFAIFYGLFCIYYYFYDKIVY